MVKGQMEWEVTETTIKMLFGIAIYIYESKKHLPWAQTSPKGLRDISLTLESI